MIQIKLSPCLLRWKYLDVRDWSERFLVLCKLDFLQFNLIRPAKLMITTLLSRINYILSGAIQARWVLSAYFYYRFWFKDLRHVLFIRCQAEAVFCQLQLQKNPPPICCSRIFQFWPLACQRAWQEGPRWLGLWKTRPCHYTPLRAESDKHWNTKKV